MVPLALMIWVHSAATIHNFWNNLCKYMNWFWKTDKTPFDFALELSLQFEMVLMKSPSYKFIPSWDICTNVYKDYVKK